MMMHITLYFLAGEICGLSFLIYARISGFNRKLVTFLFDYLYFKTDMAFANNDIRADIGSSPVNMRIASTCIIHMRRKGVERATYIVSCLPNLLLCYTQFACDFIVLIFAKLVEILIDQWVS